MSDLLILGMGLGCATKRKKWKPHFYPSRIAELSHSFKPLHFLFQGLRTWKTAFELGVPKRAPKTACFASFGVCT